MARQEVKKGDGDVGHPVPKVAGMFPPRRRNGTLRNWDGVSQLSEFCALIKGIRILTWDFLALRGLSSYKDLAHMVG